MKFSELKEELAGNMIYAEFPMEDVQGVENAQSVDQLVDWIIKHLDGDAEEGLRWFLDMIVDEVQDQNDSIQEEFFSR